MQQVPRNPNIRNIAIIAHVDHGKTTLVDHLLRQVGTFRENQSLPRALWTPMIWSAKRHYHHGENAAIHWNGMKINILDTPVSDFGGEVERDPFDGERRYSCW